MYFGRTGRLRRLFNPVTRIRYLFRIGDAGTRNTYGSPSAMLANIESRATLTNGHAADAFFAEIDPEAREELDAFTKPESHTLAHLSLINGSILPRVMVTG